MRVCIPSLLIDRRRACDSREALGDLICELLPAIAAYPSRTVQQDEEEQAQSTASANLQPPIVLVGCLSQP
jgi:hypothetical protein